MSLLIISHSYPPSNAPAAQRAFFFAKYLTRENGLNVEVVTPKIAVTAAGESDWADKHDVRVAVHRTGYVPFVKAMLNAPDAAGQNSNVPNRPRNVRAILRSLATNWLVPDRGILWYPYAVNAASKAIRGNPTFKYLLTSAPSFSDHRAGLTVSRRFGLKWIADFRDFYWVNAREKSTSGSLSNKHRKIERSVVENADACVFVTDQMRELYTEQYPCLAKKSYTIPNGFDDEEFSFNREVKSNGKFRIFYSGNFYGGERCPRPLLAAMDLLISRCQVKIDDFEIVIAGKVDVQTQRIFEEYQCRPAVVFQGQQSRGVVLQEMSQSDLLWLIIAELASHSGSFPVKGFEYFGAQRPVIAFCPNNCAAHRILSDVGVNPIFSKDSEIESVSAMILERIENKNSARLQHSVYANSVRFSRRFQAGQLKEILESLE